MHKTKFQVVVITAVLILMVAVSGFAAETLCSQHSKGTPTSGRTFSIAVASNFAVPAVTMLGHYQPNNSTAWICENATQTLLNEINDNGKPNHDVNSPVPVYSLFFGADDTADTFANHFDYARGIPVIFGYKGGSIANANGLVAGTGTADAGQVPIGGAALTASTVYKLSTPSYFAIADPALAPYGVAAQSILNDIVKVSPAPQPFPDLFGNITLTKNAVGTSKVPEGESTALPIISGFISKAQICNQNNVIYVEFTDSEYTPLQTAALLSTATSAAEELHTTIMSAMNSKTPVTWSQFLIANCYLIP